MRLLGQEERDLEILHQETIDLEALADLCEVGMKRPPVIPRDHSAWHVTGLLESARLISKGQNEYYRFQGRPSGIMSLGRVWEVAIDCYLRHYADNLGGFYLPDMVQDADGVSGSLDGIMWLPNLNWLVVETKLRFSLKDEIPLRHVQQMRSYCHLANTDLVCYVSGHVSSTPPTARATLRIIRFARHSIEETWALIVNTKRYLEGLGLSPAHGGEDG